MNSTAANPLCPGTVTIPLTKGFVAVVDACDAHLASLSWYASWTGWGWYAKRWERQPDGSKRGIYLHRAVVGVGPRVRVDHEDGDTMNCRRGNLRVATNAQNLRNRGPTKRSASGLKGVRWHKAAGKWLAQIKADYKTHYLGLFTDPVAAAQAYDVAALRLHGAFAKLNFPGGNAPPDLAARVRELEVARG